MRNITLNIITCILLICISCSNNKNLFDVEIVEEDLNKNISYQPQMEFETILDSAYWYFDTKERNMFAYGSVSKGKELYKSDKFKMMIIIRTYRLKESKQFEFVLRTFSKDFKIIDSYILGSTLGKLSCEGNIDANLSITTTCDDGTITIATVDDYGKFVINE